MISPSTPDADPVPDSPVACTVILVHGFFRTRHDMAFLERGLKRRGYRVISVELPITLGTIADGVAALEQQLQRQHLQHKRIAFVAHSMGGLIVRTFVAQMRRRSTSRHNCTPLKISHCVFIATPHQGTPLADMALFLPGLGLLFKALTALRTRKEGTWSAPMLHSLKKPCLRPAMKIGIIAGTHPSILPGRFLIRGDHDGMVPCASALAPDADAVMRLPFNHVTIHKRKVTLNAVTHFLTCDEFPSDT